MGKGRRERGDGTVFYVSGRDRWAVEFTLEDGRKTRRFFLSEREAKAYAKDTAAKKHLGVQPVPMSPLFENYLNEWLEAVIKPNRAESTYHQYRMMARLHIIPSLGRLRINEIQRTHVQRMLNSVSSKKKRVPIRNGTSKETNEKISRDTVRIIKAVTSSCLSMAVKDRHVLQNVAESAELPKPVIKEAKYLNREEASALLSSLTNSPIDSLIAFLLLTGCRLAEGQGIRWQDISGDFRGIWIRGQLKRESRGLVYSEATKTHRSRLIPIVPILRDRIMELKDKAESNCYSDPDNLIFLSDSGSRFDPKTVRTRLKHLCSKAGIKKVKVHELRHTAATLLAQATGDIHAVQKVLGHSQVSLTSNLYAHATDELTQNALHKLEQLLSVSSDC
jgi:integrase